jgi:hypothetical protein
LTGARALIDAEIGTAERITFGTSRREEARGGVGKNEDQRMSGERAG